VDGIVSSLFSVFCILYSVTLDRPETKSKIGLKKSVFSCFQFLGVQNLLLPIFKIIQKHLFSLFSFYFKLVLTTPMDTSASTSHFNTNGAREQRGGDIVIPAAVLDDPVANKAVNTDEEKYRLLHNDHFHKLITLAVPASLISFKDKAMTSKLCFLFLLEL
jgi:hypothetical protein